MRLTSDTDPVSPACVRRPRVGHQHHQREHPPDGRHAVRALHQCQLGGRLQGPRHHPSHVRPRQRGTAASGPISRRIGSNSRRAAVILQIKVGKLTELLTLFRFVPPPPPPPHQRFIQYLASRTSLFNLSNFIDKTGSHGKSARRMRLETVPSGRWRSHVHACAHRHASRCRHLHLPSRARPHSPVGLALCCNVLRCLSVCYSAAFSSFQIDLEPD